MEWFYMNNFKYFLKKIFKSRDITNFLSKQKFKSRILDVGCGNNSPYFVKSIRPDFYYVGIDIGDYIQTKPNLADEYILVSPDEFSNRIFTMKDSFDSIISCHNLEHCNNPYLTLAAMIEALKVGGNLFLAFPTDISIGFPSRKGTLNFYDDDTHKNIIYYDDIIKFLTNSNFQILYSSRRYRPIFYWLVGFLLEPLSRIMGRGLLGTWEFYGFETIIWSRKLN